MVTHGNDHSVRCFWYLHALFLSWSSLPSPHTVPGQPANLTLTQVSTTTFRVSWDAPITGGTVTGYRVFYTIDGVMDNVTLSPNKLELELALTLSEDQSYVISIDVQSLPEFSSSSKANVMIPQGKTLFVSLCSLIISLT